MSDPAMPFGRKKIRLSGGRPALSRLTGAVGAGLATAMVVAWAPAPIADHLIEADLRDASQVWQARILQQLRAGAITFTNGAMTPDDLGFLGAITRASDIHRVNLMDGEGRVFWSSRADLIGTVHAAGHFATHVARGEVNYTTNVVPAEEIDDFGLHVLDADRDTTRVVAEIDIPVILDGAFVGDIEFHRDITPLRAAFIGRVQMVLALLCGAATLVLLVLGVALHRASRAELRGAERRAADLGSLMADQMRLAREVRLLGELNGWLQSSRSLTELFAMVARFMERIMPGLSGSLYVYSNSRDVLDGAVSWNGGRHDDHIRPEDCWGLRRGRGYAFGDSEVDFTCGHVHFENPRRYVCIPILAHGETVGLMTLTARSGTVLGSFEDQRRMAQMSAEQISLAIANVRMRDALQHQAIRDPLTGLFNRRHLLESLRRLLDARQPCHVSLVSIDIDHFKRFNDNHGHDAGDMVLRAVGEVLGRHADGDIVACRMGGEELMLLLPGIGAPEAMERAERLRQDVAALSVRYGDKTLPRVTISIGVAQFPLHGSIPQDLIRSADDALYLAKARGRDQVVLAGDRTSDGADDGASGERSDGLAMASIQDKAPSTPGDAPGEAGYPIEAFRADLAVASTSRSAA